MVERVAAVQTYELRHRILQRGDTPADVFTVGDKDPESGHFAWRIDGRVVATGTIRRRPTAAGVAQAWQIRGMAAERVVRGQGIGSAILSALIDHADAHGDGILWCHARIASQTLYERQGFQAQGDPFDDPIAGRQVLMTRDGQFG